MDVDWNAELVDQLETHWQGQLRPRLNGLTDEEFFWEPAPGCWTLSRRGASKAPASIGNGEFTMDYAPPPHEREPVTTIAWRLAHLIDVFGPPDQPHFGSPRVDHPVGAFPGTADGALRRLDEGYAAWLADLRGLGELGLGLRQGRPQLFAEAPMARFVLHIHREVIHHGAEVSLLRDLYSWRDKAQG